MTALILLVIAGVLVYVISAMLHPYVNCEACGGKGKHAGALFSKAFRPCHKCSGSGQKQRLTAAIIGWGKRRQASSGIQPRTSSFKKGS
jgi:hypothetical protein